MADENETGELAGDEKAYFESRGEKIPQEKVEKPDDKEKAETTAEAETDELLDDEPKEDKKVPLRALTKEREEGKKARAALQELEKRHAVLEDRWNTILQLNQQPEVKADEDPEPDPNVDIFKHNAWLKRQVDKVNKRDADRQQTEKQAKDAAEYDGKVWQFWNNDASAYKKANAEFDDIVKWGSEFRSKQLETVADLYPHLNLGTEAGRVAQINVELKEIVVAAAKAGQSPSAAVDRMVRSWGYTGPKPKEAVGDDGKAVEKLSKDMEAETSLSGAGGSRPGAALDAKAIADMSSDEFERWYAKHGAAGFKKLQVRGNA